jgi:hypothetical protein
MFNFICIYFLDQFFLLTFGGISVVLFIFVLCAIKFLQHKQLIKAFSKYTVNINISVACSSGVS